MKRIILTTTAILCWIMTQSQVPGYYNGTAGKHGEELKTALHEIINDHVDFSYRDAKYILNYADEDPDNTNNLILFYTKRSQNKETYGSGPDDINREHVWAKSHGNFSDVRPMDGDAFNLHPSDASVNMAKSNYDFDECSETGTFIDEANAWFTSSQFEPPDTAKGEVARTIFYMAVRYEGTSNEIDLEVVDKIDTSPAPEHGKLSTLLQWNREFPPTPFERRRNERVYQSQRNRNPFIDNPEFADLIWGDSLSSQPVVDNISMEPAIPEPNSQLNIQAGISGADSAILYYGNSWNPENNPASMSASNDLYSGMIDLSAFEEGEMVYFKITAFGNSTYNMVHGNFVIPKEVSLTPINQVQGTGNSTPLEGSEVSIGGIITANFDNTFYMQTGNEARNGICVFDMKRGKVGDSVVVTGRAVEFNTLTELDNVSWFYNYGSARDIVPEDISISDVNEDYEGMLVRFRNVTFLEGDTEIPYDEQTMLTFTDGAESLDVYVRYHSRLGGKILPSGIVDVTGVISQYQGNYQLLINDIDDIQPGNDDAPPLIGDVIVNDASWIEIKFSEKLDKTTAENLDNYSIDGGVSISGAYIYNNTSVLLLVTGLQKQVYTLTVNGVADLQGNEITEATFQFESEYSSGVNINQFLDNTLHIYPNPANNTLYIKSIDNFNNIESISILNMTGKVLIYEKNAGEEIIDIDISSLDEGFYLIKVKSGKMINTELFSIKR